MLFTVFLMFMLLNIGSDSKRVFLETLGSTWTIMFMIKSFWVGTEIVQ